MDNQVYLCKQVYRSTVVHVPLSPIRQTSVCAHFLRSSSSELPRLVACSIHTYVGRTPPTPPGSRVAGRRDGAWTNVFEVRPGMNKARNECSTLNHPWDRKIYAADSSTPCPRISVKRPVLWMVVVCSNVGGSFSD